LQPSATDHVPVLAEEVRRLLEVQPGETVIDATFGAGGHAALLARDLKGEGKFIGVDRDPSVRPYFESFRRRAGVPTRFLRGDFADDGWTTGVAMTQSGGTWSATIDS